MDTPICQTCEFDLVQVGTFWACNDPACDRFGTPCIEVIGDKGYTQDEYDEECARRGERQAVSDMESGYDVPGVFGYQSREIL